MTVHELSEVVRASNPAMGVFNRREVDSMRDAFAANAMAASRYRAALINIRKHEQAIEAAQQKARASKDYETADALREILQALRSQLA
jgi:cysteinyl-tRNA synthetase